MKSNKLKLAPEEEEALLHITGALKFLTLEAAEAFRACQLKVVPALVSLSSCSSPFIAPRNPVQFSCSFLS
jgi:hypothetical protein